MKPMRDDTVPRVLCVTNVRMRTTILVSNVSYKFDELDKMLKKKNFFQTKPTSDDSKPILFICALK